MISFELDFYPRQETHDEEMDTFDSVLDNFLLALDVDNNLVGCWQILEFPDRVQVRCNVPELVALNQKNWNPHALYWWKHIVTSSESEPIFREVVEKTRDEDVCQCDAPSAFILFTSYKETDYCIRCGDCNKWIPLYRLPYLKEQECHDALKDWRRTYVNLDRLWMKSFIGERFAYEQLSQHESALMQWSRELAAELSAKTKVPVYTFLMHFFQILEDCCPRCGSSWTLTEDWLDFDFCCNRCYMVSTKSNSEAQPLDKLHP